LSVGHHLNVLAQGRPDEGCEHHEHTSGSREEEREHEVAHLLDSDSLSLYGLDAPNLPIQASQYTESPARGLV
jgi:hypothetical protein